MRLQKTFKSAAPTLYLVGTPIGHLDDLSLRAQKVLTDVDFIFCEDTRTTEVLLKHHGIKNKLVSCHKFNEQSRIELLEQTLKRGQSVALVSDAGVPIISDPGARIVAKILSGNANFVNVSAVNVGPAYVHALVASGYETPHHYFYGFLKNRGEEAKHRELLEIIMGLPAPIIVVFYESVHRIVETIEQLTTILPATAQVTIARELTKTNEEIIQGTIQEVSDFVKSSEMVLKGEFVVLINKENDWNQSWSETQILEAVNGHLRQGYSLKQVAALVSLESQWPKNKIYQLAVKNQKKP